MGSKMDPGRDEVVDWIEEVG
eukprot:gene16722-biopygen17220